MAPILPRSALPHDLWADVTDNQAHTVEGDSEKPRRRLGRTFRTAERVTNPLQNLVGRWRPITDAARDHRAVPGRDWPATSGGRFS
jgi:hypothetical protein